MIKHRRIWDSRAARAWDRLLDQPLVSTTGYAILIGLAVLAYVVVTW